MIEGPTDLKGFKGKKKVSKDSKCQGSQCSHLSQLELMVLRAEGLWGLKCLNGFQKSNNFRSLNSLTEFLQSLQAPNI